MTFSQWLRWQRRRRDMIGWFACFVRDWFLGEFPHRAKQRETFEAFLRTPMLDSSPGEAAMLLEAFGRAWGEYEQQRGAV